MTTDGEGVSGSEDATVEDTSGIDSPGDETAVEHRAEPSAADDDAAEDPALVARRNELIREEARRNIEAIVLVSQDPAEPAAIAELLGRPVELIEEICDELMDWYEEHDRGFQLVRVAGGYRFQTHPDQAHAVKRFVLDGQAGKLSPAALETLAIVAYKQPVSRAQVAAIRGVGVDSVIRTLQQRGYIEEIARDPGPGQAVLYGTTMAFLEKLGLDHLDEMPSLGAFVPAPEVLEALEYSLRIESSATRAATDVGAASPESEPAFEPTVVGGSDPAGAGESSAVKGDSVEGDSVEGDSVEGDSVEGASVEGASVEGDSVESEAAESEATESGIAEVIDLRPRPHVS